MFRLWCLVLVVSEAAFALGSTDVVWISALRFAAGIASAAIFVASASTLAHYKSSGASPGLGFAGVGAGIALTGILMLLCAAHFSWRELWVGAAIVTAALLLPGWGMPIAAEVQSHPTGQKPTPHHRKRWRLLLGAYFLEGLGYIIFGTFIVAAVSQNGDTRLGQIVWIVVGLAAAPSTIVWQRLGERLGTTNALTLALAVQTVGIAIPAVSAEPAALIVASALFGGTFMGIAVLAMRSGTELPLSRTAARLTAVYSIGQALGPLVVAPLVSGSYESAFIAASVALFGATILASFIARSFPRHAP